jgi:intein/homing endonuclease
MTGCSARWAIEKLLPRAADPFGAAELGTAAHRVFETVFGMPAEERTTQVAMAAVAELQNDKDKNLVIPSDPVDFDRWHSSVTRLVTGLWLIENPREIEIIGNEIEIKDLEIGGVPFFGYIDRYGVKRIGKKKVRTVGDYKGLALDTPIPTPSGWTTMGKIKVGDKVIGSDGNPIGVIGKSVIHDRDCFEVEFVGGERIICDDIHEWVVRESSNGKVMKVSGRELSESFTDSLSRKRPTSFSIRNGQPFVGEEIDLPIDPWVLGAWLGDGSAKSGDLTIGHADLADMLTIIKDRWGEVAPAPWSTTGRAALVALSKPEPHKCGRGHDNWKIKTRKGKDTRRCGTCDREFAAHGCQDVDGASTCGKRFSRCPQRVSVEDEPLWNLSLRGKLRGLGLLHNKHVPATYLRGSIDQRLDLLRGLMDTDGYWHPTRNEAVFVSTTQDLADAVAEIVLSLGVNVSRHAVVSRVQNHKDSYRVSFTPVGFNPFLLPRKANQCEVHLSAIESGEVMVRSLYHSIKSVRSVPRVPTQCIAVDAPDSMFLCGRTMVPTHNSGKVPNLRWGDKHGEQLRTYALALDASPDYERPQAAEVLYTQHEELRVVDLSDAAMNATLEKFQKAWATHNKLVESHEFTTKTSALCGWCPAVDVCPAAKADNKVAKIEFDIAGEALGIGETAVAVSISAKPGQVSDARGTESVKPHEQKEVKHMNEDKPWEETLNDGTLNPNSYAATAVFGIVDLAVEMLHDKGQEITAKNVRALSFTFKSIIAEVFADFGSKNASLQDGLHTRLRGALRTSLATLPAPFGEGLDAWDTWVGQSVRRTRAIAKTAIVLWEGEDEVENPWAALAADENKPVDDFADMD